MLHSADSNESNWRSKLYYSLQTFTDSVNKLGFWSVTMYNSTQRLVPNPINRYWIGADTPGITYNKDGSLDVYVQPQSPGQAKQNNWLPSPTTNQPFNMILRLYWPNQPQALNGTWSPPPIQCGNATG